jgi:hypothetical protein
VNKSSELREHIRSKWFVPIITRIEKFEKSTEVFQEFAAVTEPDSPEWVVQCLIKGIKPFGDGVGMPFDGQFGAQHVGAMVGSKSSICTAMANAHKMVERWPLEYRERFVARWGLDGTHYAQTVWKKFAVKLQPEFESIRRFAVSLAMKQTLQEDIDFHRGLTKGLTFVQELRRTIRKATSKAERDAQNRAAVYFFAVTAGETIEANRQAVSWPDLAREFNKAFNHQVAVDEETFKKILQRCGLGVGKAGRRVEVSISRK